MNILLTIAVCLAGSAILQLIGFYCYSTYQKRKLLKSIAYGFLEGEVTVGLNKQGGKEQAAGVMSGGKVAALHPSGRNVASTFTQSKSKSVNVLPQLVAR